MIFRASIGELAILLDDEMSDERPTPERAQDYLTRCVTEVVRMFELMPDAEPATPEGDD